MDIRCSCKNTNDISKQSKEISKQPKEISKQSKDISKQSKDISKQSRVISKQSKDIDQLKDKDEYVQRIAASRAKKEYKLNEYDLQFLPCLTISNPHYFSAPPMRLYVLSDVVRFSTSKKIQLERIENDKRKEKARIEKEKKIEEQKKLDEIKKNQTQKLANYSLSVEDVTEDMRAAVFGDYLLKKFPKTGIKLIKRRHQFAMMIQTRLEQRWHQFELLHYFTNTSDNPYIVLQRALRTSEDALKIISFLHNDIADYLDTKSASSFRVFMVYVLFMKLDKVL
jgi:hypothetical protein